MAKPEAAGRRRLFFALWPDAALREAIRVAAEPAVRHALTLPGARAIPAANYHIPIAFLGQVSASSCPDILRVARRARFLPFDVSLERTGYWPRSRIVWLAPASVPPALGALAADLWRKLGDLGLVEDDRPYQPHVSLCRNAGGGAGMRLARPLVWPVSSFALVESQLSAEGSVYTVLEQFPAGD